jgi:hypothetical protein
MNSKEYFIERFYFENKIGEKKGVIMVQSYEKEMNKY